MKFKHLLTALVLTTSLTAFSQNKQSRKIKNITETVEKGLIKVSIMYPFEEGKAFDMEYYETNHMPMVAGFLGSNLVKYTIEKGIASGIPNSPLPYMAIGIFYVKDFGAYQAAIGPNIDSIRADIPNYTTISPVILVSEIVK